MSILSGTEARAGATALVAVAAVAFGFVAAAQLRAQLIPSSDRVDRNLALVQSVQQLEQENAADRARITGLRAQVDELEAEAAKSSASGRQLRDEVQGLRAHAGLTAMRGPGVIVQVGNGRAAPGASGRADYLATFQDVQDVVNLLFASGAEGVAVNGRRITPDSSFQGSAGTALIDQGPPVPAPFRIAAVGDRGQMEETLSDPSSLGDLRFRQRQYGVALSFGGAPDVTLPAYDSSLQVNYAQPG